MDQLDGLLFYEQVLMGLGILLFLALLFILVFKVIKGQAIKVTIGAFLIPIVMIGWPSIEKIKYENGVIEIVKLTREAEANPDDATTRQNLATALREVEDAPVSNPQTLLKFAKANVAIGDTSKALVLVTSALKRNPALQEGKQLKNQLDSSFRRSLEPTTRDDN